MKIYTKNGDHGSTSLVGGTRISKADLRLEVYGSIDELNAHLGLVEACASEATDKAAVREIQADLFRVGFVFSCDWKKFDGRQHVITEERVLFLEKEIDRLDATLAPLTDFILPNGGVAASHAHVARTVCRRSERLAVAFYENQGILDPSNLLPSDVMIQPYPVEKAHPDVDNYIKTALRYLNRLSDYLFVLGRKLSVSTRG